MWRCLTGSAAARSPLVLTAVVSVAGFLLLFSSLVTLELRPGARRFMQTMAPVLLADDGEAEEPGLHSKYFEYGKKFQQELFDMIGKNSKKGKKQKPRYNFPAKNVGELRGKNRTELLCEMKRNPPFFLTGQTPPFLNNSVIGEFISHPEPIFGGKSLGSCACVSSSGLLADRSLGEFIDSHDTVIRMNHAPVSGYERDVGRKTTIRILNNSVIRKIDNMKLPLEKRPWDFPDTANATLMLWDACNDKGPYTKCLENVEKEDIRRAKYDFWQPFFKWRRRNMNRPLFFAHPDWLWSLWDLLQRYNPVPIGAHVPRTGFISFAFFLHFCDEISLFELIPSMDFQERKPCHYFAEKKNEVGESCFMSGYHPKVAETLFLMALLEEEEDFDHVFRDGYATIPGLASLKCD